MNKTLFILIVFLTGFCADVSAQQTSHRQIRKLVKENNLNVNLTMVPGQSVVIPGFVQKGSVISLEKQRRIEQQGFYLNRFEVSVNDYRKFCTQYAKGNDSIYKTLYPDTLIFIKAYPYLYNEPLTQVYFWHPKYLNYPVVGITYENAVLYCKWLEGELRKESVRILGKDVIEKVSLPTQAEWIAALGDFNFEKKIADYVQSGFKGLNTGDVTTQYGLTIVEHSKDGYLVTNDVAEVEQNEYGLCNMIGNVAEFVCDTMQIVHRNKWRYLEASTGKMYDTINLYNARLFDSLYQLEESGNTYALLYHRNLFKKVPADTTDQESGLIVDYSLIHALLVGASWKDDLRFTDPQRIRFLRKDERKSYAGFRFVVLFKGMAKTTRKVLLTEEGRW